MDVASGQLFVDFFEHVDILMLIMIRVLAFFIIIPVFSGANIPTMVKLAFTFATSVMIFVSGKVAVVYYNDSIAGYIILAVQEFLVGFIIGFVVFIIFSIIYFSGQLIDFQIGYSMMSVFDAITQIQVPIVGNLFYFVLTFLLVQTGGLNAFIAAMFHSYDLLPPGVALLVGNDKLILYLLQLIVEFFVMGVKVAMPVVGSILTIDVALGLLVKAVPQMNVFVVGMPMKMFAGLIILFVIAPLLLNVYDITFNDSYKAMMNMIRGMAP